MKLNKLLLVCTTLLIMSLSAAAATLSLEWDHDSPPEDKISFAVEKKELTGWSLVSNVPAGVKFVDLNIPAGSYTYRVVAVSPEGIRSEPSNELTVKVPASAKSIRIKIKQ